MSRQYQSSTSPDFVPSATLDFSEYQIEARKTAIYPGVGSSGELYPALGLANEAGEVLGKIKKVYRDKSGVYTDDERAAIGGEIADVIWYASQLATELKLDLELLMRQNLEKLRSRQERGVIGGSGDKR